MALVAIWRGAIANPHVQEGSIVCACCRDWEDPKLLCAWASPWCIRQALLRGTITCTAWSRATACEVACHTLARVAAVVRIAAIDDVVLKSVWAKWTRRALKHLRVIASPTEAATRALHDVPPAITLKDSTSLTWDRNHLGR